MEDKIDSQGETDTKAIEVRETDADKSEERAKSSGSEREDRADSEGNNDSDSSEKTIVKKRRGRPPGSRNKNKITVSTPKGNINAKGGLLSFLRSGIDKEKEGDRNRWSEDQVLGEKSETEDEGEGESIYSDGGEAKGTVISSSEVKSQIVPSQEMYEWGKMVVDTQKTMEKIHDRIGNEYCLLHESINERTKDTQVG